MDQSAQRRVPIEPQRVDAPLTSSAVLLTLTLADPAAELPACMVALDATLVIAGRSGERRVAADDFFKGMYETATGPGMGAGSGRSKKLRASIALLRKNSNRVP